VKPSGADFGTRFKLAGSGWRGVGGGKAAHLRIEPNSCPVAAFLLPKL